MNDPELKECFALMQALMEYRHHPISSQLQEIRKRHSMLHLDVLTLIYHFAKTGAGDVLEIGPYLGGSTIAAAFGVRDSGKPRTIISIELGGKCVHPRLATKNILKDLKKNLIKRGVSELITLLEGYSADQKIGAAVRKRLRPGGTSLLIIDADGNVKRDLEFYRDLLVEGCWVVIDDYYMPGGESKAVRTRPEVDAFVSAGQLETIGFYGWGTWIGRWHGSPCTAING